MADTPRLTIRCQYPDTLMAPTEGDLGLSEAALSVVQSNSYEKTEYTAFDTHCGGSSLKRSDTVLITSTAVRTDSRASPGSKPSLFGGFGSRVSGTASRRGS